jgi:hypothetical protein
MIEAKRSHFGSLRTWAAVGEFLLEQFPGCHKDGAGREVVRVAGKILAYLAANERSRPSSAPGNEEFVIIRIAYENRERLLESNPETFFVTPHYKTYPGVIVRLATIEPVQLRELLMNAWRLVAPKRLVRDWDARAMRQPVDNAPTTRSAVRARRANEKQ